MTRVGIMSFAHMHAHAYASALAQIDGAELTAVWDEDARSGSDAGRQ